MPNPKPKKSSVVAPKVIKAHWVWRVEFYGLDDTLALSLVLTRSQAKALLISMGKGPDAVDVVPEGVLDVPDVYLDAVQVTG